jgi:hypothetical protein
MSSAIRLGFSLGILTLLPAFASAQSNPPKPPPVQEEWVARYNNDGIDGYDKASALAVDVEGNVYVTGSSVNHSGSYDYTTIQYDNEGNQIGVERYDGPDKMMDRPTAQVLDKDGNVYVTGESQADSTFFDFATIKYDYNDNYHPRQVWVQRYNSSANGWDTATDLKVDSQGNVYVTGQSTGTNKFYDIVTVKYDKNGNQLWVNRYNGPGNRSDAFPSIAVNSLGNVYVTGQSWGDTSYDYVTVAYDQDGKQLWVRSYGGDGSDKPVAVAADSLGNVYVTGKSNGDIATVKYDKDGNQRWEQRYDGTANDDDSATALALYEVKDSSDQVKEVDVYVTGKSKGKDGQGRDTGYDYVTFKYGGLTNNGRLIWEKRYDGPRNKDDVAIAIVVGSWGNNVFVTGESVGREINIDYTTLKYDSKTGDLRWEISYNGPSNGDDIPTALAVDKGGNVYVTGGSLDSSTGYDFATVKYKQN